MKDAMKMYHLLLPRKWFVWIVYLLYPAILGAFGMWCCWIGSVFGVWISLVVCSAMVVAAEYMLDVFVLAGFAAKENRSLEYVKTSAKGIRLLQAGLYGDGLRRVITTALVYILLYAVTQYGYTHDEELLVMVKEDGLNCPGVVAFLQCALLAVLFTEIGFLVTRKSKNVLLNLMVLYVMAGLAGAIANIAIEHASGLTVAVSAVLLIVIGIGSRKFLIKKVRESFYDDGYKELLQTT